MADKMINDSFSLTDEYFIEGNNKLPRKPDSPVFGHSSKNSQDVFVLNRPLISMDDELNNADCAELKDQGTSRQEDNKFPKFSDSENIFLTPRQTPSIDSSKLHKDIFAKGSEPVIDESNRQVIETQLLDIQSVLVLIKSQFVFIKLESSLFKLSKVLKIKQSLLKANAFHKLFGASKLKTQLFKERRKFTLSQIEEKLNGLQRGLKGIRRKYLNAGFQKIRSFPLDGMRAQGISNEIKRSREEILNGVKQKEMEVDNLVKKLQDKQRTYNDCKLRDAEYQQRIKAKEKDINEFQPYLENIRQRTSMITNAEQEDQRLKTLESKIRDLEKENSFLEERVSVNESRVNSFVKEMSELLDSHDVSTSIGLEDNYSQYISGQHGSFEAGNFDEDYEKLYRKVKANNQEQQPWEKLTGGGAGQKKYIAYQK